jgi:hypothetical protein
VKALEQAIRLAVEIENLKKLIAADPKNQAARQRLVRLHLVDYDDPAEAAKFLEGVEDASLLKYVPAAAKPFARAKAYCERFLQLHAAEDINRSKAALLLQQIADAIQAAGVPKPVATKQGPSSATKARREEWIDLLPLVDLSKDALGGGWEKTGQNSRSRAKLPGPAWRFLFLWMGPMNLRFVVRAFSGNRPTASSCPWVPGRRFSAFRKSAGKAICAAWTAPRSPRPSEAGMRRLFLLGLRRPVTRPRLT